MHVVVGILLACWRRYTNKHRQRRSEERANSHVLRCTRSKVELSIFSVCDYWWPTIHAFVWWTMFIGQWLMCASKHHNWYQTSQKPITMSSPKPRAFLLSRFFFFFNKLMRHVTQSSSFYFYFRIFFFVAFHIFGIHSRVIRGWKSIRSESINLVRPLDDQRFIYCRQ